MGDWLVMRARTAFVAGVFVGLSAHALVAWARRVKLFRRNS